MLNMGGLVKRMKVAATVQGVARVVNQNSVMTGLRAYPQSIVVPAKSRDP
jgi:hypothetical protein